jgi:hypothetical protein
VGHRRRRPGLPARVTRVARIRRDRYDLGGALISKEVVHAVTSLDADQASATDLAAIAEWARLGLLAKTGPGRYALPAAGSAGP